MYMSITMTNRNVKPDRICFMVSVKPSFKLSQRALKINTMVIMNIIVAYW